MREVNKAGVSLASMIMTLRERLVSPSLPRSTAWPSEVLRLLSFAGLNDYYFPRTSSIAIITKIYRLAK